MILQIGVVSVSRPRSIARKIKMLVNALVTENRLNTESSRHGALLGRSLLWPNVLR